MAKFMETIQTNESVGHTDANISFDECFENHNNESRDENEPVFSLSKELLKYWERPSVVQNKLTEILLHVCTSIICQIFTWFTDYNVNTGKATN